MAYYYINTDWDARQNFKITCDIWFENKMAFAGDHENNKWEHSKFFKKLNIGDVLFMYHSKKDKRKHHKKRYVGAGIVQKKWDEICYENSDRLLYRKEPYEYRVDVDWCLDWRAMPKSASEIGLPVTPNYWCRIDETRYNVKDLIAPCT